KRIVEFVHRETPAAIGVQLGHAGRKGATQRLWEGDNEPLAEGGWPLVSASPIPYFADRSSVPREMTRADMNCAIAAFPHADGTRSAAGIRPAVPDAVRRSNPPSGRHGDDGGGKHLFLHGREHDRRGGTRRPVRARPRAPLRSVLDAPCRMDARIPAALAGSLPVR